MKIAVFGTGVYYEKRKDRLSAIGDILAFLDNNSGLWGQEKEGKPILEPSKIHEVSYDAIVLMSVKAYEMREQLLELGVCEEKIFYFEQFYGYVNKGKVYTYGVDDSSDAVQERIAILTTEMNYNGGSLAVIHAAQALKKKKYDVTIITSEMEETLRSEMVARGYKFIVYPNLPYASYDEMPSLNEYNGIVVNTLQMIQCVTNIAKKRKVIWWIHEFTAVYEKVTNEFPNIDETYFENIDIFTVSKRGREIFQKFYPNKEVGILPLGIDDTSKGVIKTENKKIIFSIIGDMTPLKSQAIFLEAVRRLTVEEKKEAEFWIIGNVPDSEYADKVRELALSEDSVKMMGTKTRKEMEEIYEGIDVVVCASEEEMLPTVVIEGMMYECVCITTDTTGLADYIEEGINGFVCKSQDVEELCRKLRWIIQHIEQLGDIKKEARRTYEQHFTLEYLGSCLKKAIECGGI